MIGGIPPKPPKKVLPLGATSSNQQQQQNNQNPNQNKQEQDNPNKDFATILAEQMRQGDTNDNANNTTQERSLSNPNRGGIKTNPRLDRGEQGQSQEFSKARGGNPATYNGSLRNFLTTRVTTSTTRATTSTTRVTTSQEIQAGSGAIQAGSGAMGRGSGKVLQIYNAADSFSIQECQSLISIETKQGRLNKISKQYALKQYATLQKEGEAISQDSAKPQPQEQGEKLAKDSKPTHTPNKPKPRGR